MALGSLNKSVLVESHSLRATNEPLAKRLWRPHTLHISSASLFLKTAKWFILFISINSVYALFRYTRPDRAITLSFKLVKKYLTRTLGLSMWVLRTWCQRYKTFIFIMAES
jgi:hypothetical protein